VETLFTPLVYSYLTIIVENNISHCNNKILRVVSSKVGFIYYMVAEFDRLGGVELSHTTRRSPIERLSPPQPYYLSPCRDAVAAYKEERDQSKAQGRYSPGIIVPLGIDQRRLKLAYNSGGFNSTEPLGVYNITPPFRSGDRTVIAGRVQPEGVNPNSKVVFFEKEGHEWTPLRYPTLDLEDTFITSIDNHLIFGGVKVVRTPTETLYRTVFRRGDCIEDLTEIAVGPVRMKGIRLVQLNKGIGVFTRPHDSYGGGQIGFTVIDSLAQLTPAVIANAPLIAQRFPKGEWGGVNEARALKNGRILALGHRAYFDSDNNKHYFPWLFIHDPRTGLSTDLGIVGASDDFPQTTPRQTDLKDVSYPVGMDLENGEISGGTGDTTSGTKPILKLLNLADNV
jgi:hypothetical protein